MTNIMYNNFVEGMQKDVSVEALSNKAYRDATNYRLITTEGSSTGSLENIKGMKSIIPLLDSTDTIETGHSYLVVAGTVVYNSVTKNKADNFTGVAMVTNFTGTGKVIDISANEYIIDATMNQKLVGAVELRDNIILFTSQNITNDPITESHASYIFRISVDTETEEQSTIEKLYCDAENNGTGNLNFSTYYPIKAISRYESPDVQKVYWVDSYNNIRYANVADNLTTTGEAYNGATVFYFSPDKFEFQPDFVFTKPTLEAMIAGSLKPGMVQYAYQLYRINGAETTISPLSDMIHISPSSDSMSSTLNYYGTGDVEESAGKGCILEINNTANIGFNRIRLYRVHYTEYNSTPDIYIVTELYTNPLGETLTITDNGSFVSQITVDEFNIASTENFKAADIDSKDNRLIAANIEIDKFDIGDFDTRAIRFKKELYVDTDTDSWSYGDAEHGADATITAGAEDVDSPVGGIAASVAASNFTLNGHGWVNYDKIQFVDVGTVTNIAIATSYYIIKINDDVFQVAASYADVGTSTEIVLGGVDDDVVAGSVVIHDIDVTISGLATTYAVTYPLRRLLSVSSVTSTESGTDNIADGTYNQEPAATPAWEIDAQDATISNISYNAGTEDLSFKITSTSNLFTLFSSMLTGKVYSLVIDLTYEFDAYYEWADVFDSSDLVNPDITVTVPAADTYVGWANAGWDVTDLDTDFPLTHDAINIFNDPDHDYDGDAYEYKYQSDCSTLGAEGPNMLIGFDLDDIKLDRGDSDCLYYESWINTGEPSYNGFASPYWSGKRSWQRDEVYRLFAVYYDSAGRSSYPSWICDLKMPSLKDTGYELTTYDAGPPEVVTGKVLYPTIKFKNLPTGAVSAQVYVVPRTDDDKSIITQGVLLPTFDDGSYIPNLITQNLLAENNVRFASPEILINRDIKSKGSDYLDFVGRYNNNIDNSDAWSTNMRVYKFRDFDPCTKTANNETTIQDSRIMTPSDSTFIVGDYTCLNYKTNSDFCFGGTSMFIDYDNASWTPRGDNYCVANYRQNVFGSQYGGYTYEARTRNYCRPCSNVITSTAAAFNCYNGDTFINYFQYLSLISDLAENCVGGDSWCEVLYVPVESSMNLDLRHDKCWKNQYEVDYAYLMQEVAGEWVDGGSFTYNQPTDLYLYNKVYSQESLLDYKYAKPFDYTDQELFDCRIKASNIKINGEYIDQWTKFPVNQFIDVDSKFNPVYAIKNVNDVLLFWQERAFGTVAINDRSLITDNNSAQLVLGTGGVLDRYDYISDRIGCQDKFSVTRGKSGVYWYDRSSNTIQHFAEGVTNLSRIKSMQSYIDAIKNSSHRVISVYDIENDEILFTFYHPTATNGYTLSYNELMGCFVSRYTYIPTMYVPFKNKVLSTTSRYYNNEPLITGSAYYFINQDRLFIHNSNINNRCYFYGLGDNEYNCYHDSTLQLQFNSDYISTKAFDNIEYVANLYNNSDTEVFDVSFDSIRCYNDYQNTDYVSLSPGVNLSRRERSWNLAVPRNIVALDVGLYPDIFDPDNFDKTRLFKERMRDKYMTVDLIFKNNGLNSKFIFNKIGYTYRKSIR